MWFESLGVMGAIVIQGSLVSDTRCTGDEQDTDNIMDAHDMSKQAWSYMTGSFIVIGIYLFCALAVFFGVKEKESETEQKDSTAYFAGLKMVFTYGPYLRLSAMFVFFSLAVATVQGNVVLYITHSLKLGDKVSFMLIVLLGVTIFVMPGWQYISVRFGKKTACAAGLIAQIPVLFSLMYIPEKNLALAMLVSALAGVGISVALLLPWSMLPDVLDLFMLEKKMRKDAMFYAFYVFFNKLAAGLALAVSQVALSLGNYKTGECTQADSVGTTLRYIITPGSVVCLLISLVALYFYPINENRRQQIKQDMKLYHMTRVEQALTTASAGESRMAVELHEVVWDQPGHSSLSGHKDVTTFKRNINSQEKGASPVPDHHISVLRQLRNLLSSKTST